MVSLMRKSYQKERKLGDFSRKEELSSRKA